MMEIENKHVPGQHREGLHASASLQSFPLEDRIAAVFERSPVRAGADFVPDLLCSMGHERLVAGIYDISTELSAQGYSVDVQYFARPQSKEPPLITMTIRDEEGNFLYPNTNLRLNPTIPIGRGSVKPGEKLTLTSEDQETGIDKRYLPQLEVERFSPSAEIRLIVEESNSPDMPYRISPVFSPAAFLEARQHAANVCREEAEGYSVIFHEQVIPAIAETLHAQSAFFFSREIPEVEDRGSSRSGDMLKIRSWVPQGHGSRPIDLAFTVEQDQLSARVSSLAV